MVKDEEREERSNHQSAAYRLPISAPNDRTLGSETFTVKFARFRRFTIYAHKF
jgi:hypothetical protein